MKELKKLFVLVILLIPGFVSAKEVNIQKIDTGVEVTKHNPTGRTVTTNLEYLYLDGKISYCVEPGVASRDDVYYSSEDFSSYMTEEKKQKLALIHYYGYEMHPTLEYYMASQALIWEEMGAVDVVYRQNGEVVSVDALKNEIINQVNHHDDLPTYANQTFYRYVGEFFDLPYFDDRYESKTYLGESFFFLTFTEGIYKFHFDQKAQEGVSLLYSNGDAQKIASLNLSNNQKKSFDVYAVYYEKKGRVYLQKLGEKIVNLQNGTFITEMKPLEGAIYGLYAREDIFLKNGLTKYKKDELVQTLTTTNDIIVSNDLYYGNYYIKELQTDDDYILDENEYDFVIDDDHEEVNFTFENKRKTSKIIIQKEGEVLDKIEKGKGVYSYKPLDNITFSLYTEDDIYENGILVIKKDTLVDQKKTENGKVVFDNLILGNYYIKEEDSPFYKSIDIKHVSLTLDEEVINLLNQKKKGNLIILKTDEEGKKLKGVTFQIYKDDTLLLEAVTNKNGEIILDDLELGTYVIKEVKTIDGYQIDDKNYEVSIKENETATINILNRKYLMPITSDIDAKKYSVGFSIWLIGLLSYVLEKVL